MLVPGMLVVITPNISWNKNQNLNIDLIIGLLCYETSDCKYFTWIDERGPSTEYKKCFMKNRIGPYGINKLVGAISGDKECGMQGK